MNGLSKATSVALLACLFVAYSGIAHAQQQEERGGRRGFRGAGGFGGFGGFNQSSLLRSEQVQKELSVSDDQKTQIERVLDESRNQSRELFSGLRDLSQEERRAKFEEMRTKGRELQEKTESELNAILNDTQSKRLEEIYIQFRGIASVLDDKVAAKLDVNDEQKQTIRDLFQAQGEMQREMFSGLRDLPREERQQKMEELREKSEELRAETEKAVKEVLSTAQVEQFQQMQGETIELDRQALFGGFGRGFGGPGGRGGRGGRGDRTGDSNN